MSFPGCNQPVCTVKPKATFSGNPTWKPKFKKKIIFEDRFKTCSKTRYFLIFLDTTFILGPSWDQAGTKGLVWTMRTLNHDDDVIALPQERGNDHSLLDLSLTSQDIIFSHQVKLFSAMTRDVATK